jgi:protein-disulfide isomerase
VDEGIRLGVTVTPAFFIYGQLIMGTYCLAMLFSV